MSSLDDTLLEKQNWHWRNSMRPARFFNLDARAAMPFCVLIFYFRPHMVAITALIVAVFWVLERRGLTVPAAMRAGRLWLTGNDRPGWASLRARRMRDFG